MGYGIINVNNKKEFCTSVDIDYLPCIQVLRSQDKKTHVWYNTINSVYFNFGEEYRFLDVSVRLKIWKL